MMILKIFFLLYPLLNAEVPFKMPEAGAKVFALSKAQTIAKCSAQCSNASGGGCLTITNDPTVVWSTRTTTTVTSIFRTRVIPILTTTTIYQHRTRTSALYTTVLSVSAATTTTTIFLTLTQTTDQLRLAYTDERTVKVVTSSSILLTTSSTSTSVLVSVSISTTRSYTFTKTTTTITQGETITAIPTEVILRSVLTGTTQTISFDVTSWIYRGTTSVTVLTTSYFSTRTIVETTYLVTSARSVLYTSLLSLSSQSVTAAGVPSTNTIRSTFTIPTPVTGAFTIPQTVSVQGGTTSLFIN